MRTGGFLSGPAGVGLRASFSPRFRPITSVSPRGRYHKLDSNILRPEIPSMPTPDWASVREQMMLDSTCIYLNTGSYGIVPRPVYEVVSALRERLYRQPTDFLWREAGEPLWQARVRLGQFVHAEPKRLIFAANVSSA